MHKPFPLFLVILFLFFMHPLIGQGSNLLIQQYNQGPRLDLSYSKFTFNLGPQLNRINTDLGTSSPSLTLGAIFEIDYRLTQNVGLVIGGHYTPVRYRYLEKETVYQDALNYLTLPLFLRLQPTKKISLGLGAIYQLFLKGNQIIENPEEEIIIAYPKGIFKNSMGLLSQLTYNLNSSLAVFINYRWVRRTSPAIQKETNNTQGLQLGLTYRLLRLKQRP